MKIIPVSDSASFSEEVTLSNKPYRFRFDWNEIAETWSMSIADRDKNVLVAGIKVVLDYELISDWVGRGLPDGELYAMEETGELLKIGRTDLKDKVFLAYIEKGEVI